MPENSPEIKAFIREYSYLFWYTPDAAKENISHELLVEHVLNYGDMNAVRKLFAVMGISNAAKVFLGMKERKALNYYPEIHYYFTKLFSRYA
jgi:hypothetical protein